MRNSNTSLKQRAVHFTFLLAGLFLGCAAPQSFALDPHRTISQYSHDAWSVENGYPGGMVYAIAQTPDGYLWLGTEKGLFRFDGLNFSAVQPVNITVPFTEPILGLVADADGSIWIRLRSPKIIRYRDGKFEDVLTNQKRADQQVTAMGRGRNGELLLSTLENGAMRFHDNVFTPVVPKPDRPTPSPIIISMAETGDGITWIGTRDAGLLRQAGDRFVPVSANLPEKKINFLLPVGERELWIGTDKSIVKWNGNEIVASAVTAALDNSQVRTMLADHESNIWVGTEADGLMRLSADGPAAMNDPSFPSLRSVTALFEDREKNLWIGTSQGIERLRDNTFMTYSAGEGLTAPANGPLFVDAENRTWFAPSTGGLSWLKDDKVENIAGLANDIVYSITGDKNDIWIGRQRGGLTRIHFEGGERSMTTYTQKDGLAQNSVFTVHRGADGSIWAGTLSGGVSKFKNGVFTNYTTADGLASDTITDIAESADGTMWFATPDGLTSLSGTQWKTYSTGDGLAGSRVECMLSGPENILWLGTNKGLAFIRDGSVVSLPDIPLLKKQPVFGLADDNHGSLWITTAANVLRLDREKLLAGTLTIEDIREFGTADGLASVEGVKRSKSVIADENGRVWLSLNRGISVADINRMKTVSVPAIVRINSIAADGNPVDIGSVPQIMSNVQRIAIGFAGLSLAAPERVRYRYMLEGFDPGFSDPTSVPEAVYTNLNPGTYRFHVIASNSEGAWNSAESSMELTIKPMLWQTWWFRMIAIVTLMLAGVGVYRLRLARLTKRLNSRFEERLAERTRIAQELHDSLLQGFVGASMQLDVAIDNLNDAKAKPALTHILGLMNKVTDEGRNTVRGLRASSRSDLSNLPDAFTRIWQDMPLNRAVDFRVIVDGTPRPLHAVVHDDIFRIGGEALINAFRHSEGSIIRVFIEYGAKKFILRVTDNGRGMEAQILQHGRDGHWGLSGMRERADRIGARLKLLSRVGNGTEVQLNVPASVAYERNSSDGLAKIWIMKLFGQAGQTEIGKSNDQ